MKHLLVGDKTLLVGNETADLLLKYSALVARIGSGDSVSVHAIDADGNDVTAGILLNAGTALVVETATTEMPEPDNAEVETYLRARLDSFEVQAPRFDDASQENGGPWEA